MLFLWTFPRNTFRRFCASSRFGLLRNPVDLKKRFLLFQNYRRVRTLDQILFLMFQTIVIVLLSSETRTGIYVSQNRVFPNICFDFLMSPVRTFFETDQKPKF